MPKSAIQPLPASSIRTFSYQVVVRSLSHYNKSNESYPFKVPMKDVARVNIAHTKSNIVALLRVNVNRETERQSNFRVRSYNLGAFCIWISSKIRHGVAVLHVTRDNKRGRCRDRCTKKWKYMGLIPCKAFRKLLSCALKCAYVPKLFPNEDLL